MKINIRNADGTTTTKDLDLEYVTLAGNSTISGNLTANRLIATNSTTASHGVVSRGNRANMLYDNVGISGGLASALLDVDITSIWGRKTRVAKIGIYGGAGSENTNPTSTYLWLSAVPDNTYNLNATLKVDSKNRVGVALSGTTRPTQALDVDGKIRMRNVTVDTDGADIVTTKGWVLNNITWSNLYNKPTTLSGFGITDAEPAFSKNSAFNKNFGSASGTVCQGNDSRLSNARTPVTHNNTYHSEEYLTGNDIATNTGYQFPTWDTNGLITGVFNTAYLNYLYVNGTQRSYYGASSITSQNIYGAGTQLSTSTAKRYLIGASATNSLTTQNSNSSVYMQEGSLYAADFYAGINANKCWHAGNLTFSVIDGNLHITTVTV